MLEELQRVEIENRWALVIGVDQAPTAQNLALHQELSAVRDAQAIATSLELYGHFNLFRPPLLGLEATSSNIQREILRFGQGRTENDFLLLYFAGHGFVTEHGTYLVTHDFNEQEASAQMHISMSWLRDYFYFNTGAGKVLLIFDCCYAGNIGQTIASPDINALLDLFHKKLRAYFTVTEDSGNYRPDMLRQALTATSYGQKAGEVDGHGIMTGYLLKALNGEVERVINLENAGSVSLYAVYEYIRDEMQKFSPQLPDLPGNPGGRSCILATHKELAEQIRQRYQRIINETPHTYISGAQIVAFQWRPDEFDTVTKLLFAENPSSTHGRVVGLLGLGGIGKTQLSIELAYIYKEEGRFPAGIFWLPITGIEVTELQRRLAELCEHTEYLPRGDDVAHPENDKRRARYLCRYLVAHPDALLILDNVDQDQIDPLLHTSLPAIAGEALRCTILYTSRFQAAPTYVKKHLVGSLPEDGALRLLLERRKLLLDQVLAGDQGPDAQAARAICAYVERFPLALTMLRDLLQDDQLTLLHLWEELQKQGTIAITRSGQSLLETRLFRTFEQSWAKIISPDAQRLFKLAVYFPELLPIPLWLLGLAAGLSGETVLESLGNARQELQRWSLINLLPGHKTISIHPLVREFGRLVVQNDLQRSSWLEDASTYLLTAFANIDNLKERILAQGYWACLSAVQEALNYARHLDIQQIQLLARVEYWLGHDSYLLSNISTWEKDLPALFYQQLSNHALEEGHTLPGTLPETPWLRQLNRVGAGDQALLRELRHPNEVTSVAISPDNLSVLTACADGLARLWDIASGQPLQTFEGHTDEIRRAVFSPDGRTIATASRDETARLWNVANGQLIHIMRGHQAGIQSIAFSPDGTKIATASEDTTARVWDVTTGEMLAYLAQHRRMLTDVVFSPDTMWVVTCAADGDVLLWNIEKEEVIAVLLQDSDGLKSVTFSPDGIYVAISSIDGVLLWEVERQQITRRFAEDYAGQAYAIIQVCFSSDGQYIAVTSGSTSSKQNIAQIWNMQTGELWCTYKHRDMISSIAFSPDGSTVVTGSYDFSARIWRLLPQPTVASVNSLDGEISSTQFSSDGTQLLIATNEAGVYLWNTRTEEMIGRAPLPTSDEFPEARGWTASTTFFPIDNSVIIGLFSTIWHWNASQQQLHLLSIKADEVIVIYAQNVPLLSGIAVSPNGLLLVTGSTDETVRILDVRTWQIVALLKQHQGNITTILFTPTGKHIVTASTDSTAIIWDAQTYRSLFTLSGHIGPITTMAISPDSTLLATGGLDGTIYLWSLQHGRRLSTLTKHNQRITCLSFSPDSNKLMTCDLLGHVVLWQLQPPAYPEISGIYISEHEIGALHWQDNLHLTLADTGGTENRPHFYHLALEGPP